MCKSQQAVRRSKRSDSFTLVELLVVMTIIAILAALVLAAGNGVMAKGMRSRAASEIAAMVAASEGYKNDNGVYPQGDGVLTTSTYANYDGTTSGDEYQTNSTLLYIALTGQNSFTSTPVSGTKVYLSFKINQVGNASATYSYVQDPWRHSYGYSTGIAGTPPYSGTGMFDLWSTGGSTVASANTNIWVPNWTQ